MGIKPVNYVRCNHCDSRVTHGDWCDAKYARVLGLDCPNYDCMHYKRSFYDSLEIHKSISVWYKPWTWFKKEITKCSNNT